MSRHFVWYYFRFRSFSISGARQGAKTPLPRALVIGFTHVAGRVKGIIRVSKLKWIDLFASFANFQINYTLAIPMMCIVTPLDPQFERNSHSKLDIWYRDILAKNFRLSTFRHVMLKGQWGSYLANWALIWQWKMSLEVSSQCKGNGLIEIFVQVLVTGRQKYLMADRSTFNGHHWQIKQFWDE